MRIALGYNAIKKSSNLSYIYKIIEHLLEKENEVHVFAGEFEGFENTNNKLIFHKLPTPFKTMTLVGKATLFSEFNNTLFSTLLSLGRNFDIKYSHGLRFFPIDIIGCHFCFAGWKAIAKKENVPLNYQEKTLLQLERLSFKIKTKILTVSDLMKNELKKFYKIEDENIKVIHYGVDTKKFHPVRNAQKKRFVKEDEKLLLYIGERPLRKGLLYLMKAVSLLKDVKLMVLGLRDDSFFKDFANKLQINDRVIFQGFIDSKVLSTYFSMADLFLLPSLFEPFGLVVLEAMACGTPVMVSKRVGSAELIKDNYNGIILENPTNATIMAEKIKNVLENENLLKRIGKNGRKTAEQKSWDKVAEEWLDFFQQVYEEK